ncbi:hypothetical protein [Lactobacillus delbrueckii]|nr:hypothetical protein [Lactobacillus delbrueckii]GHN30885.1 hypothetical protein ME789_18700 [Lactobacillus delbrueckii]
MAEEEKKLNVPNLQIPGQDDSPLFQGAGSDGKSVTYPKKFANHPGFLNGQLRTAWLTWKSTFSRK